MAGRQLLTTKEKHNMIDDTEKPAASPLIQSTGSDYFLDKFGEPISAYTFRKVLSNQFKCKCFDGMWCYAKGNQRPCDAGLIPQNTKSAHGERTTNR